MVGFVCLRCSYEMRTRRNGTTFLVSYSREPVVITGGGGVDLLSEGFTAARAKDRQREAIKRSLALPENELPMLPPPSVESSLREDTAKTGKSFPG